jgi:adenylate cyclase
MANQTHDNNSGTYQAVGFIKIVQSNSYYSGQTTPKTWEQIRKHEVKLCDVLKRANGTIIKVINNESILFTFPTAHLALQTTIEIMEEFSSPELLPEDYMDLKIGFIYGNIIREDGDVYGQKVALASRMTDVAKEGQILIDKDTVESFPDEYKNYTRLIDHFMAKGISEPVDLYEVTWALDDMTENRPPALGSTRQDNLLNIRYESKEFIVDERNPVLTIGRDDNANLTLDNPDVSRTHVRIEYIKNKFVLFDQSINGTYIEDKHGKTKVHRNELHILFDEGQISVACDFSDENLLIEYSVH